MKRLIPELGRSPRVLCLGAHCDDIEIGCGGTLQVIAEEYPDARFHHVVFSGGETAREQETRCCLGALLPQADSTVEVLSYRDGFFPAQWEQIKERFETIKHGLAPDLILTHARRDRHQDHALLSNLTWNTFRDHLILEYEIHKFEGDLGHPNVYVRLSEDQAERKISALLDAFESQQDRPWFRRRAFEAILNMRGIECAAPTGYAEAFYGDKLTML